MPWMEKRAQLDARDLAIELGEVIRLFWVTTGYKVVGESISYIPPSRMPPRLPILLDLLTARPGFQAPHLYSRSALLLLLAPNTTLRFIILFHSSIPKWFDIDLSGHHT